MLSLLRGLPEFFSTRPGSVHPVLKLTMLNTSTHELVFIRACVLLLRYAPIFYLLLPLPLSILGLLAELAYYLFVLRRFESRLTTSAKHPLDTRQEREALFERCIHNVPDIEHYLSLWALGADLKDIKRDNIRDFYLWAFLDREDAIADDDSDISEELEGYIAKTEAMLGQPLPLGRGHVKPLRLTFDTIQTRYRSVFWYLIVGLIDITTHVRMLWAGFKFYAASSHANIFHVIPPRPLACLERLRCQSPSSEISYWFRPAIKESTLPVVFLHGIGIGLYPYVPFLDSLPATSSVLVVEILPISMRLTTADILARPEFLRQFKEILRNHGVDQFVLVGHSYGSVLVTHILHDSELAPRVDGVVLVDPVTLLLHLPTVAYNFTRRRPRTANEWQLWYLASMDPGIALVLGRHFFWRENIIWKEELLNKGGSKRRAAVCLASRDLIVDTQSVARYLVNDTGLTDLANDHSLSQDEELAAVFDEGGTRTNAGLDLFWFTGLDHAQVFDKPQNFGRVLKVVEEFCTYN